MRINILLLFLVFFELLACSGGQKEKPVEEQLAAVGEETIEQFAPLEEGTVCVSENDFGEIISLVGKQILLGGPEFKVGEPEMLIRDGKFLMKNLVGVAGGQFFMLYSYPEFEYLKSFGVSGKGPDEFLYPRLVSCADQSKLAYAIETTNSKLYSIDSVTNLSYVDVQFEKQEKAVHSDKQLYVAAEGDYYYVDIIRQGQAMFHAWMQGDSLITEQIYNLSFSPKHKNWAAYIGDFAANAEKKRAVYAYKYFKRIAFVDLKTNVIKILDFKEKEVQSANEIITLGPDNITYYWGISTTSQYIYLTYSGRTPIQVTTENSNSDGYIFIEQFDWNGTPIRKYRLDHWGRSIIDEKDEKLYLLSYLYDDPMFEYNLLK